jgi:CheY-like chemotaxis protein
MKMKKILLIDDDGINNFINERLFKKLNFAGHIEIRRNGREALEYLHQVCELKDECPELIIIDINMPEMNGFEYLHQVCELKDECPELIVIDINMPEMNGFEFLEEFRKLEMLNKHNSRVIMLSTSSSQRDIERLRDLHIELVRKPLNENKIRELVSEGESQAYHGYN